MMVLWQWRKKNSEKVTQQRKQSDRKYYVKNRDRLLDKIKISYHEYCITHSIPAEYFEDVDDKLQDITADHPYFDNHERPHNLWNHSSKM